MKTKMKIFPFRYYVEEDHQYCPKCATLICNEKDVTRTICRGGFFKRCPKAEHFHRACHHCGGVWLEGTIETCDDEVHGALRKVFDRAAEAGTSETELIEIWRDQAVRSVMES